MTNPERELHLVPYMGDGAPLRVTVSPLASARRRWHMSCRAALSALACLFFQTVVVLLALSAAERIQPDRLLLRLAEQSFLGAAVFTLSDGDILTVPDFPAPTATPLAPSVPEEAETPAKPDGVRHPIAKTDLSDGSVLSLSNATEYKPDMPALLASALPFSPPAAASSEPYILILHTHATEAYTPEGEDSYSPDSTFRSTDTDENTVAVGAVLAEELRAAGIPTLHCTELFDAVSYSAAYANAAEAIRAYLDEYPSIRVVLDVHRDSLVRADGTRLRPATEIAGESTAQIMLVVGTDEMGGDHPNWEDNLTFALQLQDALLTIDSALARPINLRGATFNEQYRSGSLLVEIGSCGNTLSEAKRAAKQFAYSLIRVLTGERDV